MQFLDADQEFKSMATVTLGAGSTSNLCIKTRSKLIHLLHSQFYTGSTSINVQFIESISGGDAFASITPLNLNRSSVTTSDLKIITNSTIGGSPLVLLDYPLIKNRNLDQLSPEFIMKSDSNYTFRFVNNSTAITGVDFYFVWYESFN
jgi:hypothetical protein